MIISIDTETAFDKIQHFTIEKSVNKLGNKVNFISLIKDSYKTLSHMYVRLIIYNIVNCKQHFLVRTIQQEKEIKDS